VQVAKFDVGGTQSIQQSSMSVHGSMVGDVVYAIDGVNTNWPGGSGGATASYYDQGMFEQVNFATSAIPAEQPVGGVFINMVTKSGTNEFNGSMFYNTRNDNFVGTKAGPNTFNPGTFKYHDIGVALGGPIIRNRLFFFASFEDDGQTTPGTTFLANSGTDSVKGNMTRVLASDLNTLSSYLQTNFNYATGPYQGYDFKIPSTRFLARLDYNVNDRNKLSLRYNLLNSSALQGINTTFGASFMRPTSILQGRLLKLAAQLDW